MQAVSVFGSICEREATVLQMPGQGPCQDLVRNGRIFGAYCPTGFVGAHSVRAATIRICPKSASFRTLATAHSGVRACLRAADLGNAPVAVPPDREPATNPKRRSKLWSASCRFEHAISRGRLAAKSQRPLCGFRCDIMLDFHGSEFRVVFDGPTTD